MCSDGNMDQNLSPKQVQKIIDKLNELKAVKPCPRCGNQSFTVLDGILNHPIQKNINNVNIGGPSLPSIVVVCNKCGFISQHAIITLGLVTPEGEVKIE
jgi:thymidine kinase